MPVAVDATLISPLHADRSPFPHAHVKPGSSFSRAEDHKRRTYHELTGSSLLRLVVVASETGGRLNSSGSKLLLASAEARARTEPRVLRRAAARGWRSRWTAMPSVCVQDVLAATLVDEGTSLLDAADGQTPGSVDVWLDAPPPAAERQYFDDSEAASEAQLDGRQAVAAEAPPHLGSATAAAAAAAAAPPPPAAQPLLGSAVPPQPSSLLPQPSAQSPQTGLLEPGARA